MVDAVVSFVVKRLENYLIQEANFLLGVRDEVVSLKNDLRWMQCFVKDAETKQSGNDLIRQWVSDIRDIAYDAEDVLDKYMLSVHDEDDDGGRRQGFFASVKRRSCIFSEKITLYNIGKEVDALKKRLADVSRRCEAYNLRNIISETIEAEKYDLNKLKQLRRATSFAVEENPVGFEDDTDVLLAKIFDEEARRLVISIYGMGGLGKTTLARKLYHNNDVKNKFNCCAWVSVSQDYKRKDLLLRIIKSFDIINETKDLEKKTEDDLERCIRNSLQGYSYLMVVDDIWDKDDWASLKRAFPENDCRSRVIITTRIKGVAERSDDKTYVHKLRFLRQDEGWQLFCEKAFRNRISRNESGLEKLGREMVQKCGGLPLAIVVLGGLLSTKKPQEWRLVRDHLWRHLRSDSIEICHLLELSFNDLPYQLKLCFLYLGIFPEDFEIIVERLIRLLVAEDFIPQTEDRTMEEVAKDNLDELINRSLIKVEKICWGRVATFRVHDLLRDLAIQKAKELNFIHICDEMKNSSRSSVISSCRRQAIYSETPSHMWLHHANSLSRSLLLFIQEISARRLSALLFTRFSLLRVFEVDNVESVDSSIPLAEKIGKLIHLKYLGLRDLDIGYIPSSIVNLLRLQTLDLSGSIASSVELPNEINMMEELRHLIGNFIGTLPIENLNNLQTLKYVQPESWSKVDTAKLVNLRELHIEQNRRRGKKEFSFESVAKLNEFSFESVAKLRNLQFLSVQLRNENSFALLQPLSHCQCLIDLRLKGSMEELPADMHELLPNLECLSLSVTFPEGDPMPALEMLPNLTILDMSLKFRGCVKKLRCRAQGFPLLESLELEAKGLLETVEWQVEEGSMPMLRGLKIQGNLTLKIPERLRSILKPAQ